MGTPHESRVMSHDFERLMLPHLDAAYRLAVGLTRDDAAAQDIVQDSYLRAFRAWWRFTPGHEKAWLLTIVRRRALTWLKADRRHPGVELDDETLSPDDQARMSYAPEQEARIISWQTTAVVREAVGRLPAVFREVIILKEFEDMAYKDIARVTGVPVGTVMSRLSRAREMLRVMLVGTGRG